MGKYRFVRMPVVCVYVRVPALTTLQEYDLVRQAIQTLSVSGQQTVSYTLGDLSVQYAVTQLPWLVEREKELARRLTSRNQRKRTTAGFY